MTEDAQKQTRHLRSVVLFHLLKSCIKPLVEATKAIPANAEMLK